MKSRRSSQEKRLVNGCIGKHGYDTEDAAFQKGQASYFCVFCEKWHRASIHENDSPQTLRQTIAGLTTQLETRRQSNETLTATLDRYQRENAGLQYRLTHLRAAWDKSLDAKIARMLVRLRRRFERWSVR